MARLEVACFNLESALVAVAAGADRIELCGGSTADGGTTPSKQTLEAFHDSAANRKATTTNGEQPPVYAMIRPRGGDFVYSTTEFTQMKAAIAELAPLVDGFVFGILQPDNKVDESRCQKLVRLAATKPCTFHRAFDAATDLDAALEVVVRCGFRTVLTSGGEANVVPGRRALARLAQQARGRIEIMPGGGVRSKNLRELSGSVSGVSWWHSSAIVEGEVANAGEIGLLFKALEQERTSKI